MTATNQIFDHFISHFGFTPNQGQLEVLRSLATFVDPANDNNVFVLTGPAGSGKTSLLRSLISWFNDQDISFSLAAPTGRAAQIAGKKTCAHAVTLHSMLFRPQVKDDPLQISFIPKFNEKHEDVRYYLVDEASMISDATSRDGLYIQDVSLLSQLFRFVKQGNPRNRIIFIGDRFQLPPVNSEKSPALEVAFIKEKFNASVMEGNLDIVERTASDSYILDNARNILSSMQQRYKTGDLRFVRTGSFSAGIKNYLSAAGNDPFYSAVMIALANSQVNALNTWARNFRYNYKNKFTVMNDELMLCNQNTEVEDYTLYKGNHFIVKKSWKPEEFAGLHFINAEIEFDNHENVRVSARTKILIESVSSKDGMLTHEQENALLHEAYRYNKNFRETKKPKDDAFVSALRARYGYALTCHKAQGGEWNHVFLHPGYRKDDLRWLYTAVTRAMDELYSWSEN